MDLDEIWCSECGGFVGYVVNADVSLPPIMHGPCAERLKEESERPARESGLEIATDETSN